MFLEVGKDSKVFKTIYFSRIFLSMECLHLQFTKREWAKRANPSAPWFFFLNLFKVRARPAKVIFVCCFRDPHGLLSSERDHVSPPNIWRLTAIVVISVRRPLLLLLPCFWSARSAHNLGMNFIYKGIAVLESTFHFEIKDWGFLTAGSLI